MSNQWDTYADVYDKGIGMDGDALHASLINPLIERYMGNKKYDSILDAGCGNGYLLKFLACKVQQVVGIDASKKLLSSAAKNTMGLTNITIIKGDIAQKLSFESCSFNLVIVNMVLQYLPSLKIFASESARILKPGGLLFVIVDHPGRALFLRAQELAGKNNDKFLNPASYFTSGNRLKKSLWGKATLEYYHRPTEAYINPFTQWLQLDTMTELSLDGEMPNILGLKWKKA